MKQTASTKTPATSDDAPVLTAADFKHAKYRIAGESATKAEWKAAVQEKVGKQRIGIVLDAPGSA